MDSDIIVSDLQWYLYFLKLGAIGFGGPLALIAQMQADLVKKSKLIEADEFSQALALIKTLPGPIAIQMIAFMSYRKRGFFPAIISSFLFVLPSFIFMLLLSIFYRDIRSHALSSAAMDGMQAGALALIASALFQLLRDYFKTKKFWFFVFLALSMMMFFKVSEVFVIFSLAIISVIANESHKKISKVHSIPILELGLICLKAGGLAFGTGIAIIPLLQKDFVTKFGWVTQQEFLDALAFGQMTPGPISVTVTFVGYRVAGFLGAVVATAGIFAPGVFNMTTWFPRVYDWFSNQKWIKEFVLGAISAVAAGIVVSLFDMSQSLNYKILSIAVLVFSLSRAVKIKSWLLIGLSALLGTIIL